MHSSLRRRRQVAQAVAAQLDVEALPAEPQHLGGRRAVVAWSAPARPRCTAARSPRSPRAPGPSTARGRSARSVARPSAAAWPATVSTSHVQPRADVADGEAERGWPPLRTDTAEISTCALPPPLAAQRWWRRTAPTRAGAGWRSARPGRRPSRPPSGRAAGPAPGPRLAASAISRKAALAVRMSPSLSVTTKPSGALSTAFSSLSLHVRHRGGRPPPWRGVTRIRNSASPSCRNSDALTETSWPPRAMRPTHLLGALARTALRLRWACTEGGAVLGRTSGRGRARQGRRPEHRT